MQDHKDLDVWKMSMDFVVDIYRVSAQFPREEVYGLTNQLRRSAVSIPSNIAEGAARDTDKDFLKFLYIALGSAAEAETQLILANRLQFGENLEAILSQLQTIRKLLSGLIRHYKKKLTQT